MRDMSRKVILCSRTASCSRVYRDRLHSNSLTSVCYIRPKSTLFPPSQPHIYNPRSPSLYSFTVQVHAHQGNHTVSDQVVYAEITSQNSFYDAPTTVGCACVKYNGEYLPPEFWPTCLLTCLMLILLMTHPCAQMAHARPPSRSMQPLAGDDIMDSQQYTKWENNLRDTILTRQVLGMSMLYFIDSIICSLQLTLTP